LISSANHWLERTSNGGIKIRLIILLFQDVFGKMDEIRSSNFNTLAAVSK